MVKSRRTVVRGQVAILDPVRRILHESSLPRRAPACAPLPRTAFSFRRLRNGRARARRSTLRWSIRVSCSRRGRGARGRRGGGGGGRGAAGGRRGGAGAAGRGAGRGGAGRAR